MSSKTILALEEKTFLFLNALLKLIYCLIEIQVVGDISYLNSH